MGARAAIEVDEGPHGDRVAPVRPAPARYRLAFLTWAAAYGVITPIIAVLGPAMATWPLPFRTLLMSALMVSAMSWLVMPFLTRRFRSWLR
jgi:uncharacterized protein